MLNLVNGPAGSGKTDYLLKELHKYTDNNIVNNDVLILLPSRTACENFIHRFNETPILGLNIETFRSFSLKIIENAYYDLKPLNYGYTYFLNIAFDSILVNYDSNSADDSALSILNNWRSTASMQNLYNTLSGLMRERITERKLGNIAQKTDNRNVSNTCLAFAILFKKYKSLLMEHGFYDESETENIASKLLSSQNTIDFNYKIVIVDGFNRFVQSQIDILAKLIRNSSESYVSFCFDKKRSDSFLFKYQNKLINRFLSNINNAEINYVILNSPKRFADSQIRELENNLHSDKLCTESAHIQLIKAESPYEEITKVAMEIKNIVLNDGISIDKIAIIYRSNDPYADIIPFIFKKYNIPIKYSDYTKLNKIPIFQWLMHTIKIIEKYNKYFDIIFSETDLSELVEFLVSDFTYDIIRMNCKTQIDKLDISKCADNIKESGLISFHLLNDTTSEKTKDRYVTNRKKYLNKTDTNIIESLNIFLSKFTKISNKIELIEKIVNLVMKYNPSFTQILLKIKDAVLFFKNTEHTQTEPKILSYIKNIANEINISNKKTNYGITVGNIVSTQIDKDVFAVFVVGLNQSKFPVNPSSSPFLPDELITELSSNYGYDNNHSFHEYEDFLFYKALTITNGYLFLSYSQKSLNGDLLNPSAYLHYPIFTKINVLDFSDEPIKYILPGMLQKFYARKSNELEIKTNLLTKEDILANSLNFLKDNILVKYIAERHALSTKSSLKNLKIYSIPEKYKTYLNLSQFTNSKIESIITEENIIFSNSSLKKYLTCPYKFLVDNIFRIKETKEFDLDAGILGNIFHKAMEYFAEIFSTYVAKYDFNTISSMKQVVIKSSVEKLMQYFYDNYQIFLYKTKFKQFEKNIIAFKEFLNNEIDRRIQLCAKPIAVELAFGIPYIDNDSSDNKLMKSRNEQYLEIMDGQHKINICGFIDLVDVIEENNITNYLIIDYKKTYDFEKYKKICELFTFLNLEEIWAQSQIDKESTIPILNFTYMDFQLPIYLMALKRVFKIENANSAVFYHLFSNQFAGFVNPEISNILLSADLKGKNYENIQKNITDSEIEQIVKDAEKLIIFIVNLMKNGVYPISPDISHAKSNKTPCDYCPYISICRIASN